MSLPKKAWRLSSCCFSCFCAACVGAVGLGLWLREGSGLYGVSLLSSATWSVDAGCALVACAVAISLLKPRPGEIAMVRGRYRWTEVVADSCEVHVEERIIVCHWPRAVEHRRRRVTGSTVFK